MDRFITVLGLTVSTVWLVVLGTTAVVQRWF